MDDSFKNLISTFLWPDIGKLHFEVTISQRLGKVKCFLDMLK